MKVELCDLLVKAGLIASYPTVDRRSTVLLQTGNRVFLDPQYAAMNIKRLVCLLQTVGLQNVLLVDGDHTRMKFTRERVLQSRRFYKIDTWDWWFLPFAARRARHLAAVNYTEDVKPDVVIVCSSNTANHVARESRRVGVVSIGLICGNGVNPALFDYTLHFSSKMDELLILDILDFIDNKSNL